MALATERQAATGPIVSVPERFNIADYLVDRHVREGRGGRTAILFGDESISYAQVAERSNRLANGLRAMGLRREERVMLLLHDTPAFVYGFFGAQRIGAVPIPTNTLLKSQDYQYMLNDSRARVAIVSEVLVPQLAAIPRNELPYLEQVVIDGAASGEMRGLGQLLFHLSRPLDRDAVLLGQAHRTVAFPLARSRRIELEAAPSHAYLVAVLKLRQGGLETPLAHVAPRASDVGPDLDFHQGLLS